jgi:pantoate--beta-alanine ligase
MGNLHAGHIALVRRRRSTASASVSIFVNRLQFEPGGDFDRYPRTLEADCDKLRRRDCDVVFAPDEREMYPGAAGDRALAAARRAHARGRIPRGHFQGVVTVVAKLLNIVQPDCADLRQEGLPAAAGAARLVRQLNFGVKVVPGETVREPDGLAMSSRNGYLSPEERTEAVRLVARAALRRASGRGGRRDFAELEKAAKDELAAHGWRPDYIAVRAAPTWAPRRRRRELVTRAAGSAAPG